MGITLDEAQRVGAAAVDMSRGKGVRTAVAVVDNAGSLIALARLDGARSYYPDIARGKAMATALWDGIPSRELISRAGGNSGAGGGEPPPRGADCLCAGGRPHHA